jgi:hypothetical protein
MSARDSEVGEQPPPDHNPNHPSNHSGTIINASSQM